MAGTNLRKLGVNGANLPTKKSLTVRPSDFAIGGLLIEAERKFLKAFTLNSPEEYSEIFGKQVDQNAYGPDAVQGFFANVVGVDAKLVVQSLMGYDTGGDVIDAVVAARDKVDVGSDADAYSVEAAYKKELQYGIGGNRTGTKFTQAERFATQAAGTVAATGVSIAVLDSVAGIRVGDLILFKTNAGASPVYKIVTAIDENAKTVGWTGDFEVSGASGETLALNDDVVIPGFKVQTYTKSISGVETEIEEDLGVIICSSEALVTDFYVENIHAENRYVKITEASASSLGDRLPVNDSVVTYPTNGADGTAVATVEAQDVFLQLIKNEPYRLLANPETSDEAMQKAIETFNRGRTDTPLQIVTAPENQSKSQLITLGNKYQRSDDVFQVIPANWLEVTDPFSTSAIAPARNVPNVGHIMGAWIRAIGLFGIHTVPATNQVPIYGALGVVGEQLLDDRDRTDVAEAGVNMIQEVSGVGIKLRNLFTPSTTTEFLFGNGLLMRNFIKVSGVDSLSSSENTPNSLNRITSDKMAMLQFFYSLWFSGSTGDIPEGETLGQSQDEDGNPTVATDHFQVIADITNNPQAKINIGERNIDSHFTYPSPAGSIRIGAGFILRS